ncbi:MAG: hypothetical protein NTW04_06030, partial [Elusimicrobia bacterium]|nr:hypothetical protein [Elusimicrobiota bacterium]
PVSQSGKHKVARFEMVSGLGKGTGGTKTTGLFSFLRSRSPQELGALAAAMAVVMGLPVASTFMMKRGDGGKLASQLAGGMGAESPLMAGGVGGALGSSDELAVVPLPQQSYGLPTDLILTGAENAPSAAPSFMRDVPSTISGAIGAAGKMAVGPAAMTSAPKTEIPKMGGGRGPSFGGSGSGAGGLPLRESKGPRSTGKTFIAPINNIGARGYGGPTQRFSRYEAGGRPAEQMRAGMDTPLNAPSPMQTLQAVAAGLQPNQGFGAGGFDRGASGGKGNVPASVRTRTYRSGGGGPSMAHQKWFDYFWKVKEATQFAMIQAGIKIVTGFIDGFMAKFNEWFFDILFPGLSPKTMVCQCSRLGKDLITDCTQAMVDKLQVLPLTPTYKSNQKAEIATAALTQGPRGCKYVEKKDCHDQGDCSNGASSTGNATVNAIVNTVNASKTGYAAKYKAYVDSPAVIACRAGNATSTDCNNAVSGASALKDHLDTLLVNALNYLKQMRQDVDMFVKQRDILEKKFNKEIFSDLLVRRNEIYNKLHVDALRKEYTIVGGNKIDLAGLEYMGMFKRAMSRYTRPLSATAADHLKAFDKMFGWGPDLIYDNQNNESIEAYAAIGGALPLMLDLVKPAGTIEQTIDITENRITVLRATIARVANATADKAGVDNIALMYDPATPTSEATAVFEMIARADDETKEKAVWGQANPANMLQSKANVIPYPVPKAIPAAGNTPPVPLVAHSTTRLTWLMNNYRGALVALASRVDSEIALWKTFKDGFDEMEKHFTGFVTSNNYGKDAIVLLAK